MGCAVGKGFKGRILGMRKRQHTRSGLEDAGGGESRSKQHSEEQLWASVGLAKQVNGLGQGAYACDSEAEKREESFKKI